MREEIRGKEKETARVQRGGGEAKRMGAEKEKVRGQGEKWRAMRKRHKDKKQYPDTCDERDKSD